MNDSLESQAAPALDEQFDGQEGHSELGEMSERQKLRGVLLNNFNTRYKEHLEWVEAKRKIQVMICLRYQPLMRLGPN